MKNLITGKPDKIQFAKDGKYEEAWVIDINDPRPEDKDFQEYLDRETFNDLIVEFLWRSRDGENLNVITLMHNENLKASSHLDFMNLSLRTLHEYVNFEWFTRFINSEIIGFDFFLKAPLDIVRVGVMNHWFSVGPVDLWKKGDPIPDMETVKTKIAANPKLNPTVLNYQALAFLFNADKKLAGPFHVIKAPCAKLNGESWEMDYEKTQKYLTDWITIFTLRK